MSFPPISRGRSVLLLCNHGVASAFAARHLRGIDVPAYNVRGGTSEWVHGTIGTAGEDFVCFEDAPGRFEPFPFHDAPLHEQLALVISGLVFKPIYTLLSLALVAVLWRSDAPDLVALRRAMIFFFLGENACAANYWFFDETSYLFEYLHGFGMMLCFGFTTYAFLEGLDRRVLLVTDAGRKCALLPLCGRCIKHSDVPCGVQRLLAIGHSGVHRAGVHADHRGLADGFLQFDRLRNALQLLPSRSSISTSNGFIAP